MADADQNDSQAGAVPAPAASAPVRRAHWLPWLAWGWAGIVVLAAVAELSGWDDLRLALDFQRHFR